MPDAPNLPAALTSAMALSAYGHAAVIGGILDGRTTSDTRNGAALNALWALGFPVVAGCRNPDCDCLVRLLGRVAPTARIVPVLVQVCDHDAPGKG